MTVNTNHVTAVAPVDFRPALWQRWIALRNGEVAYVEEIIAPRPALHTPTTSHQATRNSAVPAGAASTGQGRVGSGSRQQLISWVAAARAALPAGRFAVEMGPVIMGDLIAGRWLFVPEDGHATAGTDGALTGVDILRAKKGQIVEFWTNHGTLDHALWSVPMAA